MNSEAWLVFVIAVSVVLALVGLGWFLARRKYKSRYRNIFKPFEVDERDYLRCLNFLLNDEQDKAVQLFTKMVDVDAQTVETHLALGALFRRRGEMDRALRVHQNVVARTDLHPKDRAAALLELARDYQSAGMYDRAEGVLLDLAQGNYNSVDALTTLVDIYEQQKDWDRAVQVMRRVNTGRDPKSSRRISHYYCEQAAEAVLKHEPRLAEQYIKQAQQADKSASRPWLLKAKTDSQSGNYNDAIKAYRRAVELRADVLPAIMAEMLDCHRETGVAGDYGDYLKKQVSASESTALGLAYVEYLHGEKGVEAATEALRRLLQERASPELLLQATGLLMGQTGSQLSAEFAPVQEVMHGLRLAETAYKCSECGFDTHALQWRCPSCKSWDTQQAALDIPKH